jgi:sortase B
MRSRKRKRSGMGTVRTIVFIIALIVFCIAGYKLYTIFHEYYKGDSSYEKLQIYVDDDDSDGFKVDFDKLKQENPDIVAWIRIDSPVNISYPVMQSDDNNYYLRRLFDRSSNILGSIFMDYSCNADLTDDHTIIYGHNTKNGSMFGGLKKWQSKNSFDKNPYFYIYTPDGLCHTYKICAACVTDDQSISYQMYFAEDEDFLDWQSQIQSSALYNTGVELDENSKIVTLSTCTNRTESERLVIHGVETEVKETQ